MIDTISISILKQGNEKIYNYCLENSNNKSVGFIVNSKTRIVERTNIFTFQETDFDGTPYQLIKGKVCNPSSTYSPSYRIKEDRIELELSLPKFIYDSNSIMLVNHHTGNKQNYYLNFVNGLHYVLKKIFSKVILKDSDINYNYIVLRRFDICFNQHFDSMDKALKCLTYLKVKHSTINTQKDYETGLIDVSKNSYQKIYHKGTEFIKKDKKALVDSPFLTGFLGFSSCILRYERQMKPSNWSYIYHSKFGQFKTLHGYYLAQKKRGKIDKKLSQTFERTTLFVLGSSSPLVEYKNVNLLTENFFNFLVNRYLEFIQKSYNLRNQSVSHFTDQIAKAKNKQMTPKEKGVNTTNLRILALIKCYKSIDKALELKVVDRTTAWRYKKHLEQHNLSTTCTPINFNQDFSLTSYFNSLHRYNLLHPFNFRNENL